MYDYKLYKKCYKTSICYRNRSAFNAHALYEWEWGSLESLNDSPYRWWTAFIKLPPFLINFELDFLIVLRFENGSWPSIFFFDLSSYKNSLWTSMGETNRYPFVLHPPNL